MLGPAVYAVPRFPGSILRRFSFCKMSTTAAPISHNFISVEEFDISSTSKPDGFRFHVLSYNILAQVYVKSSYFPHSPSACLRWKARSKAVLTVLKNINADILCLQEVDEYDSFYKGKMEMFGYSSVYVQRNGQKRDGCGIFYKPDIAKLLLEEKIEYNDLVNTTQDGNGLRIDDDAVILANGSKYTESSTDETTDTNGRGDPNDPRVRLKRDCVGIMCAFRLADPSHHVVIVANTHIYWDPEWSDVKLAQAKYLISRLNEFKTLISDKFECVPCVIVAGDFNSIPGDKVYEYMNQTSLCSVYGGSRRGEPSFTNCTPGFTNTIDYIFYSPSDGVIKPISLLQLPQTVDSIDVVGGLPNFYHPSDHLPIGAHFQLTT